LSPQTCWACGVPGHMKRECPHRAQASPEGRGRPKASCGKAVASGRPKKHFQCHKKGHLQRHCPLRRRGRSRLLQAVESLQRERNSLRALLRGALGR
uniref:CCHC-type domain-containing protein n=1 Tax=Chelydra serpentina TaxID=8475 RepID=A0A8C3XQJ6_CHESE